MKKSINISTPKVYQYSAKWKIFGCVFFLALALICAILGLAVIYLKGELLMRIFILLIMESVAFFFLYQVLVGLRTKIIIFNNKIVQQGVFSKKQLLLSDIEGFRVDGIDNPYYFWSKITIIPKNPDLKKVEAASDYENSKELIDFLSENFSDLTGVQESIERKNLLQDSRLGKSEEERERKMLEFGRVSTYFTVAAFAIGVWTLFFPKPYNLAMLAAALLPILALLFTLFSRNYVHIDSASPIDWHPNLGGAIIVSGLALNARAILDFQILNMMPIIIAAFLFWIILLIIFLYSNSQVHYSLIIKLFYLLFLLYYAYGVAVQANVLLDNSQTQYAAAIVTDKLTHLENGQYTYQIQFDTLDAMPVGDHTVSVPQTAYTAVKINASMTIFYKKGFLGSHWYNPAYDYRLD